MVGFYLINVGYVALALKYGERPTDLAGSIEAMSTKVGFVLLVLGAMHFLNLYVFSKSAAEGPAEEPEASGAARAVRLARFAAWSPAE